jgi:hypothetical protein
VRHRDIKIFLKDNGAKKKSAFSKKVYLMFH